MRPNIDFELYIKYFRVLSLFFVTFLLKRNDNFVIISYKNSILARLN